MSTVRTLLVFASVAGCTWGFSAGCSTDERQGFGPTDQGGFAGVEAGSPPPCETNICSRDLHDVLSGCTNELVRECPSDLGCAKGECVPACASAEANEGTIGCTFWTTPSVASVGGPPSASAMLDQRGSCFAAFIANTWSEPVNIEVEYRGAKLDLHGSIAIPHTQGEEVQYESLDGPLPAGQIAIVFLHEADSLPELARDHIDCPLPAAVKSNDPAVPLNTGSGNAFRISTDYPVSAYSMYPYGGALSYIPSATVLFPTSAWDTKYLAVNAADTAEQATAGTRQTLQVIAAENDTEVRIRPRDEVTEVPGGTTASDGFTKIYNLAKGELLQIALDHELVGSAIESNKPIGVFGGSTCGRYPNVFGVCCCDIMQQQIPPLRAWGTEYAAVRYDTRRTMLGDPSKVSSTNEESVPWRFIGAANGTTLVYSPERPEGAPTKLEQGEAVTFWTDRRFVVRSQDERHPFYLASYMTSMYYGDPSGQDYALIGDPDFVNVVPTQQYLDSYTFFTDMTYDYTSLVVVRQNGGNGFKDVTLDCTGPLEGWRPLDGDGRYEYTYVTMVRNRVPQVFSGGTCENGRHEIRSDEPFALTVWGLSNAASYGYPGGAGLRAVSTAEISVPR